MFNNIGKVSNVDLLHHSVCIVFLVSNFNHLKTYVLSDEASGI